MTKLSDAHYGTVPARSPAVLIVCRNEQMLLDPPRPDIAAQLTAISRTAVADAEHGYRLVARLESLLEPAIPRPNAGLLPAVCRLLARSGCKQITLRRSSEPPTELLAPNEAAVRWHGLCDTQMLAMIREQDHGLIRYDARGGVDMAWLISQVALACPRATLAVVVASVDFGHRLQQRIDRWVSGVVMLDARPSGQRVGRVVISTPYGLADDTVELNKRDIVIFPRAEDALHEHAQSAIMTAEPRFRLFGFLPIDCKFAPSEQDWIRATFGFAEVSIPRHGFVARPVRVVWSPVDGGPRLPHNADGLALKRLGVWHHPVRNRRIARIAAAFRRRDIDWLQHRVPENAAAGSPTAACRVLLLVEAVEHALALAKLLPGWPVIVGDGVIEYGLDPNQRQLLSERVAMPTTSGRIIATITGLSRRGALGISAVDVLIWAGGGSHLPPLPANSLVCRHECARALLLVDFNDRHHPQLRRWSRCRREAYADVGWFAPGADPLQTRVDQFLAKRPGGRAR